MITKEQVESAFRAAELDIKLPEPIPSDAKFADLGLDSLDTYNVFVEIEAVTQREIPDKDIEKLDSIDAVVKYFA